MKDISEIYIDDYSRDGKINIEFQELKKLFKIIEQYHQLLGNMLDDMNDDEKNEFVKAIDYVEYMLNKYLLLPDISRKQKEWYETLQKFKSDEFTQNSSPEAVEETRRDVWGLYLEAKKEREDLKKELDMLKEKQEY